MVVIKCPIIGCSYETTDCSEAIACVLLTAHTPQHTAKPPATGPRLDRPRIDTGITPEEWNIFKLKKSLSFQNMMFIRKDDTLVTERKRSNNKHMYKLEASRVN